MTFILEYNSILTRKNPKCVRVCVREQECGCVYTILCVRVYKLRGRIT